MIHKKGIYIRDLYQTMHEPNDENEKRGDKGESDSGGQRIGKTKMP